MPHSVLLNCVLLCPLQAQDRCHRIGQTREVHIYRLVSEKTIEENILSKSDQKRQLDHLAIQSGGFNTEFLQKFNPKDLLGMRGVSAGFPVPVAAALRVTLGWQPRITVLCMSMWLGCTGSSANSHG